MVDRYEYKGLSESAKNIAITKLKENPAEVNEHIENFRNLLMSKPHLTCPTDSSFLLTFLRVAKFDYKKAEAKLDNFCTLRGSTRGIPEYFDSINVDDPMVEEFLEKEFIIPLGISDERNLIVLIRTHLWDPDTIPVKEAINLVFMSLDILMEDEELYIHGIKILYDLSGMQRKTVLAFNNVSLLKNITTIFHEGYPIRLKGEIFYNEPEIFDSAFQMYTFFKSDKKKRRVCRVKGNIENLKEVIPGIEKIMPSEYGGQAGPLREITRNWNCKFREYYKNGDPRPRASADESKRPEETKCYLNEYPEYTGPILEDE